MAAKIQIKNDSVKIFGGFFSFADHFRHDGMAEIIDKTLGYRSVFAKYSNSDIFLSLAAVFLTGGSCIEDANRLSSVFTEISQGYRFCSADTIRLEKTSRVKRFVFSFVSVPFKWVVRNCRKVLLLYTGNADYMRLQV